MEDFEEVSNKIHIKYIDTIAEELENFSYFKKIEREISVFTQPLTISVENVSRADLLLELSDLQSDPFFQGRTELGSMLGSTYICESSFSNMKFIKSKYTCSLPDKCHLLSCFVYQQQIN